MTSKLSSGIQAIRASVRFQKKPSNYNGNNLSQDLSPVSRTFREEEYGVQYSANAAPILEEEDDANDANAQHSQSEHSRGENASYYQNHVHDPNTNLHNNDQNTQHQHNYIHTQQNYATSGNEYGSTSQYNVAPQPVRPDFQGYSSPIDQGQNFQNGSEYRPASQGHPPPQHVRPAFQGYPPPTGQSQNFPNENSFRPTYPGPSHSDTSAAYNQGPVLESQRNSYYDQRPFDDPRRSDDEWQNQSFTPSPGQMQRAHTVQVARRNQHHFERPPEPFLRSAQTFGGMQNGGGAFDDIVNSAGARAQRGGQNWNPPAEGWNRNW